MLLLDNINEQLHNKFTHDFEKLLKNHNDVSVCFGKKANRLLLTGHKNILFKMDDYNNVEKKIIKHVICYLLLTNKWKYAEINKFVKDKNYYTINFDNDIELCNHYVRRDARCDIFAGLNIIYDTNNNTVKYYSKNLNLYCAYHGINTDMYNLNLLFNSKYEKFKLLFSNNNKIDKNDNITINDNTITIQIITNTENFSIEFINMDLGQVFNKLMKTFHNGKLICDNYTYKFIKS